MTSRRIIVGMILAGALCITIACQKEDAADGDKHVTPDDSHKSSKASPPKDVTSPIGAQVLQFQFVRSSDFGAEADLRQVVYIGLFDGTPDAPAIAIFDRLKSDSETPAGVSSTGKRYLAGRVRGRVQSVDTFEPFHVDLADNVASFVVRYTRVETYDLEPQRGNAYFKLPLYKLPDEIKEVRIHFVQVLNEWDFDAKETRESPLEPPVLHDVFVPL